ncbi:hypothetical protein U3516DRAFT_671621 [Neocallimastix sp. 'constans']
MKILIQYYFNKIDKYNNNTLNKTNKEKVNIVNSRIDENNYTTSKKSESIRIEINEIPEESEYYKTENGDNFMIFKNPNLIIFQSPFQAKLFTKYNEDIFTDEFFKINYLNKYNANNWNYYNNIKHITNNTSESFNNYLNNLFQKIPTFYKLITALKKEEVLSYNDYDRRIRGFLLRKIKTINRTDEIKVLIERYINKEEKLIFIECDDDDIVELCIFLTFLTTFCEMYYCEMHTSHFNQ